MPKQTTELEIGSLCRSRDAIVKTLSDDDARLCRVVAAVPPELLAMPITAFLRGDQLAPLS